LIDDRTLTTRNCRRHH